MQEGPLTSWKSVADYLGRGMRTVQRWHDEYGLPVRHLGGGRGTVVAYPEELDSWLRSFTRPAAARPIEKDGMLAAWKHQSRELTAAARKMWELLSENNVGPMARLYRKALDVDPDNAEAFAGVASALIFASLLGNTGSSAAYARAASALEQALLLDSALPEAQCAQAWLRMVRERNWAAARDGFDAVLRLRPQFWPALTGRALLSLVEGRLDDASGHLERAHSLTRLDGAASALLGWSWYLAGGYEGVLALANQARAGGYCATRMLAIESLAALCLGETRALEERLTSAIAEFPHHLSLRGALGYFYGVSERRDEAKEIYLDLTRAGARDGDDRAYPAALVLLGLNEKQKAVSWLTQSYEAGSLWSLGFRHDPVLAPLKGDAEFDLLLRKIGFQAAEDEDRAAVAKD